MNPIRKLPMFAAKLKSLGLLSLAGISLTGSGLFGQTAIDWTSSSGNNASQWGPGNSPQNWTSNAPDGVGAFARFRNADAGLDGRNITLGQNRIVGRLEVDRTGTGADFSLSGDILTFDNGTSSASILSMSNANRLTINSGITIAGNGVLNVNQSSSRTLTLNGAITGGRLVRNTGNGVMRLSGNNSGWTAGSASNPALDLNSGITEFSADNNLGAATNRVRLNNNATLRSTANTTLATGRVVEIASGGGTISVANNTTLSLGNNPGRLVGSGTLTLQGNGTLRIQAANEGFTGNLNVNSGTLLLGADNVIGSGTNMTLSGGTFATNGFSNQLGTLTLSADSVIDFSGGNSVLKFADSSGVTWDSNATLTIVNWDGTPGAGGGFDQLFFGTNGNGLTEAQRSQIVFANYADWEVGHLPDGEVVPVPEPAAVAAGIGLLAFLGWRERRRLVGIWQKIRRSL